MLVKINSNLEISQVKDIMCDDVPLLQTHNAYKQNS